MVRLHSPDARRRVDAVHLGDGLCGQLVAVHEHEHPRPRSAREDRAPEVGVCEDHRLAEPSSQHNRDSVRSADTSPALLTRPCAMDGGHGVELIGPEPECTEAGVGVHDAPRM